MKKYYIIACVNNQEFGSDVLARSQEVAVNKMKRRASQSLKVSQADVTIISCEYLGFYLGRRFFPASYGWAVKS